MLNALDSLVPVLLAIALASERLIEILKTLIPALAEQQTTDAGEVDLTADRARRIGLQLLAVVTSYVTVGLAFNTWSPIGVVTIGNDPYGVAALALLGSGGSAFWSSVLGYVKAVKDIKKTERAAATLRYRIAAQESGTAAYGTGEVVDARRIRAFKLRAPNVAFSS